MKKFWKHPHNLTVFLTRLEAVMVEHRKAVESAGRIDGAAERKAAFADAYQKLGLAVSGDWPEAIVYHGRAVVDVLPD